MTREDKSDPLVSVVMPVHNRFTLADESVASVVAQIYYPMELIIVDDYSDEPYQPKIQSNQGLTIKVIRHETNLGPGASRETGRLVATGDFICYLDSDDLWHHQKLEKQVALLQSNPNAGMCYCMSVEFSHLPITGNEPLRNRSDHEFSTFLPTIFDGRPWGTAACMWTKEATDFIGPWFNGWTWEDYEYDCRAGCRDIRIIYLQEILCYYRRDYGEFQLSKTKHQNQIAQKASSLLSMSHNLSVYKKLDRKDIHNSFLKLLYFQAMHSFLADDSRIGKEMLVECAKNSKGLNWLFYKSLIRLSLILSPSILGSILYKFRNSYQ